MCAQYEKLDSEMPISVKLPFPPLSELGFKPITGDERHTKYEIERLDDDAARYSQSVASYKELTEKKDLTEWETTYIAIGPLFLAIAIAIRLTKTSGEIRNEKKAP